MSEPTMTDEAMPVQTQPPIDVAETLHGRSILLIGTTGFVGKVMLSMLLHRYPAIGRVFALVRPGMGNTAEERFFGKVVTSPAFDPLREVWRDGFDSFMRTKVVAVPGDIGQPFCNLSDELFAQFEEDGLDCIINSAGLVSFTPSLESAIRINALGAKNVLETARRAKAKLLHVSTCFVAGRRNGEVWEDEPVCGYFPRHEEIRDDDFDAQQEIADCQRIIEQVRELANDRAHISEFRERAAQSLQAQRRDPDNQKALALAVARERKIWVSKRLTELGVERAEHWGWTNTYTYTKSLGEQLILADEQVHSAIVRPAIVESAVRYPSPGWNEGFNTTAPLVYLVLKGHRHIVAGENTPLDLIPVDLVAAGMISVAAGLIAERAKAVYQLGTSDVNPVTSKRLAELTGLAVRRYYRDKAAAGEQPITNRLRARAEMITCSYEKFQRSSAPRVNRIAATLSDQITQRLPRWGAPRLTAWAERAQEELSKVSDFTQQVTDLIELFKPFTYDCNIAFRCDNTRALHAQLTLQDQCALPWDPDTIDWRQYWFETHFPGLQKWVFPVLDDEFGAKPRSVYTYKDVLELFDAATKLNRHRVAMRLYPTKQTDAVPVVYTYERVQALATQGAGSLREHGVNTGDRVMLMSENRPEWGTSYFAILKAGATAVPVDNQLAIEEVLNLLTACGASTFLASPKVAARLTGVAEETAHSALQQVLADKGVTAAVVSFADVLRAPSVELSEPPRKAVGSSVASVIYTSGTTGEPKGVMLSHKNLTAMVSRLGSVFRLYKHDSLLSVLPLHHMFEFSAGLLMPFVHGSSVTYLDEVDGEALSTAFEEGNITGMVGVPALWNLLHRKVFKTISERGLIWSKLFEVLVEANRKLRDTVPYGWNIGKLLFYPIHRKLGGRQRLLISGGSALSSDLLQSFRGLGFKLVEGYGMTEASPVLTVMRPNEKPVVGSVGRALPGVDVQIFEPDTEGVGEIVAKGPNVMMGYYENELATAQVLQDGWLHTGDLGRIDEDGNVYIVGRKKEMILGASGENVYPDELEQLYGDSDYVREISIVGLPGKEGGESSTCGETVAALVVPDYEQAGVSREQTRSRLRAHMRDTSARLPLYKRVRIYHLWDRDLPKTATRKVKRREVVLELERIEQVAKDATSLRSGSDKGSSRQTQGASDWVSALIAQVAQKPRSTVQSDTRLDTLGFDSLMVTELGVAFEAAGVVLPDPTEIASLSTVSDVAEYVAKLAKDTKSGHKQVETVANSEEIHVPAPLARVGRKGLRVLQRATYERLFDTKVTGASYIPPTSSFIVAANHASHLDMGLVKHALGEHGDKLVAMAAKDYFFEDPIRRAYFENFTNLVPMERYGSLRESLRLAVEIVRGGKILLIFPEGTRSETGVMIDFKASLGYLATAAQCGILPMYLAGTHDAFPKGAWLPKKRTISAHIGPFASWDTLAELGKGRSRSEQYRTIASHVEEIVRGLTPPSYAWTLGESGRRALASIAESEAGTANTDPNKASPTPAGGSSGGTTGGGAEGASAMSASGKPARGDVLS